MSRKDYVQVPGDDVDWLGSGDAPLLYETQTRWQPGALLLPATMLLGAVVMLALHAADTVAFYALSALLFVLLAVFLVTALSRPSRIRVLADRVEVDQILFGTSVLRFSSLVRVQLTSRVRDHVRWQRHLATALSACVRLEAHTPSHSMLLSPLEPTAFVRAVEGAAAAAAAAAASSSSVSAVAATMPVSTAVTVTARP